MTTWQHAIIGFCRDLSDSSASSIPVGVLAVARSQTRRYAAIIALDLRGLDPVSDAIFADFPAFLKEQVDRELLDQGDFSMEKLFRSLHNALRNSFHVISISTPEEIKIDGIGLAAKLVTESLDILSAQVNRAEKKIRQRSEGDVALGMSGPFQMTPRSFEDASESIGSSDPQILAWPLRASAEEARA